MADKTPQEKALSRRDFLKAGLVATGGIVLGLGSSNKAEAGAGALRSSDRIGSITVNYNGEGLPYSYSVSGKLTTYSENEMWLMRAGRKWAALIKNPQFLTRIDGDFIDSPRPILVPDSTRPLVTELTEDVLSEEELSQNGVMEIIQGEKVKLHIRRTAFKSGGILYDLARSQLSETNPVKLRIVLVDGPYVSNKYVEDDPKYDEVAYLLPNDGNTEDFRREKIDRLSKYQEEAFAKLQEAVKTGNQDLIDGETAVAIAYSSQIVDFQMASQDELTDRMLWDTTNHTAGLFFRPTGVDKNGNRVATVFIAVGDSLPGREHIQVYSDLNGKIILQPTMGINDPRTFYRPTQARGFPRPEDFYKNTNASQQNGDYPYGAQNYEAGFILTHELEHLQRITIGPEQYGNTLDDNEYNTDMSAMAQIDKEYQDWINKGENTYPFVFVDEETGQIQVTKRQPVRVNRNR